MSKIKIGNLTIPCKLKVPKGGIAPLEYRQPFWHRDLTKIRAELMSEMGVSILNAGNKMTCIINQDKEIFNNNNNKKQKTMRMRTDVELLVDLKDFLMGQLDFVSGLCQFKSKIAKTNKEERRLDKLIREMRPVTLYNDNYYWRPGDRLVRYAAINSLISKIELNNKKKKEKRWELIKEVDTPRTSYYVGNTFTKREIFQFFDIENPEKYPEWFKEVKKEKTLQDYEELFFSDNKPNKKWVKDFFPKQYYSIILQMIADDLCEQGIVKKWFIKAILTNNCFTEVGSAIIKSDNNLSEIPIDTVKFDTRSNTYRAMEIMGDAIRELF